MTIEPVVKDKEDATIKRNGAEPKGMPREELRRLAIERALQFNHRIDQHIEEHLIATVKRIAQYIDTGE